MNVNSTNAVSNSPLKAAAAGGVSSGGDSKIALIRNQALETIRRHFPITALFTPELEMDLGTFIKDQVLFRRIAEFLAPLVGTDGVTSELIANNFANSGLLTEIKAMFTQDPSPYLALFYEACADVLNEKPSSNHLRSAIEGRIFTLKNALIAQRTPEAIVKSRVQFVIVQQDIASIKEEGTSFIRESLRLHLSWKEAENIPFKEQLIATAEQLVPFVQKVTKMYLRENGNDCPDNPLIFRNPTGYNQHGLVAAAVMEACLDVLGFRTRLLNRTDLEPMVTLAIIHNIVEVTGPDQSKYLVDPCYMQFHKDICPEDALLPTSPVLILGEAEVEPYVENTLMVHWRASDERVRMNDIFAINSLIRRDQILSHVVRKANIPKELIPSNLEGWVRKSLQRVWAIRMYNPVFSDRGYQDIFVGSGSAKKTHEYVKAMGIAALSRHSSEADVEKRLNGLLCDPKLKGQNSTEALSLVAQLSTVKRMNYGPLFDVDPRIKRLEITLNAYFCSLKKMVNPEGKDKSVIYGCAGADCMTVLLATDANDFTFVDLTTTSYQEFVEALAQLKNQSLDFLLYQLEQDNRYISKRMKWGGTTSDYCEGKHAMKNLALKLLFDLRETAVDLSKVVLTSSQNGRGVCIEFPWQSHGAASSRMRRMTFVTADITKPDDYPAFLKAKIEKGFDIFYMKAAFLAPLYYPRFLPYLAKSIKAGGWLMTADKTFTMEAVNPQDCLEQNGMAFELKRSEKIKVLEELMSSPHDPFIRNGNLDLHDKENRHGRRVSPDLTYWSILSLRQKNS